jgi:type I restriction enzyme S subunit
MFTKNFSGAFLNKVAKIASYLRAKSEKISSLVQNLEAQITALEQYRKSLIHESVTGKRRITDADISAG